MLAACLPSHARRGGSTTRRRATAPRHVQGVRSLFGTLMVSLPAFWNVGALMGLLFYIYAYIGGAALPATLGCLRVDGMPLAPFECSATSTAHVPCLLAPHAPITAGTLTFGRIRHGDDLNEHANFDRFWISLLTLLRASWQGGRKGRLGGVGHARTHARTHASTHVRPCTHARTHARMHAPDTASPISHTSPAVQLATNDNWTNIYTNLLVKVRRVESSAANRAILSPAPPWDNSPPTLDSQNPQPPGCDHALGDCGTWFAIPYTLSFVLLVSVIMLNLFTAVIIENFEKQQVRVEGEGLQHRLTALRPCFNSRQP